MSRHLEEEALEHSQIFKEVPSFRWNRISRETQK